MKPLLLSLLTLPTLAYTPLSDHALTLLPPFKNTPRDPDPDFDPLASALLSPILRPRVPGTPGHAAVQHHFVSWVQKNLHPSWRIEWHNTTAETPIHGKGVRVPFANLVLRRDPPWVKPYLPGIITPEQYGGSEAVKGKRLKSEGDVARLTLAAHYDSLYKPEGFIGAIDSAVPCALVLYAAKAVDEALTRKWEAMARVREQRAAEGWDGLEDEDDDYEEEEKGLQIILFDGEEAWLKWSAEDSLYGSRALASTWSSLPYPSGSKYPTPLSSISLLLLLDLLGSPSPTIPSYFLHSHVHYLSLSNLESRLRKLNLLESSPRTPFLPDRDRDPRVVRGYVEDDHMPFLKRG
ncbi:uncharacterized protein CTHT_0056510 [Thermochaetoides thermophila DSM 1495]|uniref:Peptide hydrolase n=1 Tax=Chaetomium thermophilum (strain DSM 1495 / CBS 144.50 / IMI 039719) TaxID=759272 RepID=G0SCA3_CHATD|nr:hypothetical protein CTHT_0056510 [Thermochaetoides thermophila DSM 1495]EGS19029.1 hypothetical protein CTHT_0056510 [Thermochaetoides thermophila DSM 1495]